MYIESIELKDFRTFAKARIEFLYRGRQVTKDLPAAAVPNVNVLLGDNGAGKTSVLRAIALAGLGPLVADSGIFPHSLVRKTGKTIRSQALIGAQFVTHPQDQTPVLTLVSATTIHRKGEVEQLRWSGKSEQGWDPIYSVRNQALFMVGYGATRRVERPENYDVGARSKSRLPRAQRVQGLFEDSYSLIPLGSWLPAYAGQNPGRYKQVVNLLNRILAPSEYRFSGQFESGDYLFKRRAGGTLVPFQALSDGYRALVGWVGDLLYHVCFNAPKGEKLVDTHGIAMVDEVDLHLHPAWQMQVIESLSKALPKIQFIFTTHSPLIVGSLEWMNVLVMQREAGGTAAQRVRSAIHGLDADQLLVTDLFGLASSRAPTRARELKSLGEQARSGSSKAALQLLTQMSRGTESAA